MYVEQTLGPTEKIVAAARFNWTYSFGPVLWFSLSLSPLIYVTIRQGILGNQIGSPAWIFGMCFVVALFGAIILIRHFIHIKTTEIVVTTSRFVLKKGFISRDTKEVSLRNIEEINLQQSVLGRIFGYGHMTIRGTGVGLIQLPDIDDPIELRRTIEGAKATYSDRNTTMAGTPAAPTPEAEPATPRDKAS